MSDGVLAEVLRGDRVESRHGGRAVVVDAAGRVVWSMGDVAAAVYPRSTVKALLALPLVETGTASRLNLSDDELALACASHNGEAAHAETAARMLSRVGRDVGCLECGTHWPTLDSAARELAAEGKAASPLHNNCSGKHAGMICVACDQGIDPTGYISPDHPVQQAATAVLAEMTGAAHEDAMRGIDGCSMPTYAIPLTALARGFARFGGGVGLHPDRAAAASRLRAAVAAAPFMVAGSGRFDTVLMRHFGERLFCKMGAEGVMVAALPQLGLGFALKADDGGNRAVEVALAALLRRFGGDVLQEADHAVLDGLAHQTLRNWNGLTVGAIRAAVPDR
ncbi:L-asparaginase II [Neoasaia chiangmaiensis NBRC 101099]|uniref:Asparaginase n=1 Tax=Neoasaia chiangmaiensis TaxID=320497 RepID=A0A1U9KPN3_9PROT|nr:asparaginase [Neoasaia chiangmaiensis]AQS87757.1 asparaginase [Neoasaia chiangmaiensis]GBR41654.1 L-asparaginase II [Neoasaia chiangmaiensis NBRC 101099]GEN14354.1 asparaginase [Neoasaia chiangmaiensis]